MQTHRVYICLSDNIWMCDVPYLILRMLLNFPFCLDTELYENLGQVGASIKHHLVEGMRNMWQQLNEFARSHSSTYSIEKEQADAAAQGVYHLSLSLSFTYSHIHTLHTCILVHA